jgi:2-keto-4-pentenoate hydratase
MERVGSLHPAIELPDSRYNEFEKVGAAQLVADNACAHRFILGPKVMVEWRSLNLAEEKPRGFKNGEMVAEGLGANVLGDPRIGLTWLVNELSRHGLTLKAGEAVTTGTCIKPAAIAQGDRIEGDFGPLGRVSVAIV